MKKTAILFSLLFFSFISFAQNASPSLYNPSANATEEIAAAIKQAKVENKHVLLQIGGNWCKWCIEFNRFCKADAQIDSLLNTNFVVYHLNYSKENKNEEILKSLKYPQRFGFPVFVVLDADGNMIHTENSSYLEEGKSYSKDKIIAFIKNWNRAALLAETYEKK